MTVFYLISIIICNTFQNVVKKPYTQKTGGKGSFFFSMLVSLVAMLFFALTAKKFDYKSGLIIYSFLFAFAYITGTVFALYAIAHGSLSLTSLILSYSLIIPTIYGLVFLKDPISFKLIFGIVLLVISLFLINKKDTESQISFKWIIYVTLAFLGNGMCTVFQKMQQIAFEGEYKNEFMTLAIAIVFAVMLIFVLKKERKEIKLYVKAGWHLPVLYGLANGIVNLFVMILSGMMPISVMFPIISAGGIIITYLVSKFFYREKLSKTQFIGFLIGIVSVVFLS